MLAFPTAGEKYVDEMSVGQSSLCSQVLPVKERGGRGGPWVTGGGGGGGGCLDGLVRTAQLSSVKRAVVRVEHLRCGCQGRGWPGAPPPPHLNQIAACIAFHGGTGTPPTRCPSAAGGTRRGLWREANTGSVGAAGVSTVSQRSPLPPSPPTLCCCDGIRRPKWDNQTRKDTPRFSERPPGPGQGPREHEAAKRWLPQPNLDHF